MLTLMHLPLLFLKIVANKYVMPYFFTVHLKDLVKNLLQLDLSRWLGNMKNGVSDIREHKWFRNIDWMQLFNRKVDPPYVPKYLKPGDVSTLTSIQKIRYIYQRLTGFIKNSLTFSLIILCWLHKTKL